MGEKVALREEKNIYSAVCTQPENKEIQISQAFPDVWDPNKEEQE